MNDKPDYLLSRNSFGRLVFVGIDGDVQEDIVPVRAFPITEPERGIALISSHGRELAWIEKLSDLPAEMRKLVDTDLMGREFVPEIRRIDEVSGFVTPSTWYVETDRGKTAFILKGEEYIRRLESPSLLIMDSQGIHFLIRDRFNLDRHSRKILDRFL